MSSSDTSATLFAAVCLRTGRVVEPLADNTMSGAADDLAAAAEELFQTTTSEVLSDLLHAYGSGREAHELDEVIVLSTRGAYVARRLKSDPARALIAVSPRTVTLGLVLSELRVQLEAQEGRR